jgi:hypothetical protein
MTLPRFNHWLYLTLACVLPLAACTSLMPPSRTPPATATVATTTGVSVLDNYVKLLETLSSTNVAAQTDAFFEIERSNLQSPTTLNQLRYAVALAMPGHPASDPVKAKRLLQQVLASPEYLSASEQALSRTMLAIAEQWLALQTENRRLTATVDDRTRSQSNSDRRLQAQADEISRLRKALDAAQQKLDAIRDIEKSISERSTTPSGTRDSSNRDTPTQTQTAPAGR